MVLQVRRSLAPADIREVGVWIAKLQAAFPAAEMSDAVAEANQEAYLVALEDVPGWALSAAYKRVLKGTSGLNPVFMPTPPQLRALADEATGPIRAYVVRLMKLLDARIEAAPPERPADVGAIIANATKGLPESKRRRPSNPAGVDHSQPFNLAG